MTSGSRISIAAAALAVAVVFASLGYRHGVAQRAERIVQLKPELDLWHQRLERDGRLLENRRRDVDRWVRDTSVELSKMQARIVQADALARRLIDRTEFGDREFDFSREPALGGPEEAWIDANGERAAELPSAAVSLSFQIEDRWRQLRILDEVLKWRDLNAAVRPEGRPVGAAYVSSGFGPRIDPFTGKKALHNGIDFAGRRGMEIVAVAAGIVTWSGPRAGYGRMVEIDHGNQHVTRYAHNSQNLVAVGEIVTRGQPIAKLGSTGRATGPNLHFEVLQDGRAVNPVPYIK